MIANAVGASVIAIDISDTKLALAKDLGAVATINGATLADVSQAAIEITKGGAHVSLNALGHSMTYFNSTLNLRPRGKHIQVGLMLGEHTTPQVPMAKVIAKDLELLRSHGMQAQRYVVMLRMISSGKLNPSHLVGEKRNFAHAPGALMNMNKFQSFGATVITEF